MKQLTGIIDYISIKFPYINNPKIISNKIKVLKISIRNFTKASSGKPKYDSRTTFEDIVNIYFNIYQGMDRGVLIEVTGRGCRAFEDWMETTNQTWSNIFEEIILLGGEVTRLDIAIDDKTYSENQRTYLNLDTIENHLKNGHFKSKTKKYNIMDSGTSYNKETIQSKTIYIGARKSTTFIRLYDKKSEQKVNYPDNEFTCNEWLRYEIELKNEKAHQVAKEILNGEDFSILVKEIFNSAISFTEPNRSDSNKARWKNTEWWDTFIGESSKFKFETKPKSPTLEKTLNFLYKNAARSLSLVKRQFGMEEINRIISYGDELNEERFKGEMEILKTFTKFEPLKHSVPQLLSFTDIDKSEPLYSWPIEDHEEKEEYLKENPIIEIEI